MKNAKSEKVKHLGGGAWVNKDNFAAINWRSSAVNYSGETRAAQPPCLSYNS